MTTLSEEVLPPLLNDAFRASSAYVVPFLPFCSAAKGPVPPLLVTIYKTTDTPPLWNSTTVILSPPPPAPPAAAPSPAPASPPRAVANLSAPFLPVVVRINSSNVTVVGLAQAPLPLGALVPDAHANHAVAAAGVSKSLLVLSVVGLVFTLLG